MPKNEKQSAEIRVLQLIDSLDAGGGERMAVNLANALVERVEFSGLVTTRKEGLLKKLINEKTNYLYSGKRSSIDLKAWKKTTNFIKEKSINIIHAHGSSFFFAVFLKIASPSLKIVWHDHHGNRINEQSKFHTRVLIVLSQFFSHVFCVSEQLVVWSQKNLKTNSISYINNFVFTDVSLQSKNTPVIQKPYILCVANLRKPKNHINLIKAFAEINTEKDNDWELILVGEDKNDDYSKELSRCIVDLGIKNSVKILGQRSDVQSIIKNADICVLSSDVEALPMVLIEYATAKKPVVVTDVGQCAEVVGEFGKVVSPNDSRALAGAIKYYMQNPIQAEWDAEHLCKKVKQEFNPNLILKQVIEVYNRVLN